MFIRIGVFIMQNKKFTILCSILLIVIVLAFSASYALFRFDITKDNNYKISLGNLELVIEDATNEDMFILENIIPTKDSIALKQDGYSFTITNTGTIDSNYALYLDDIILDLDKERLNNSYVRFNLVNNNTNDSITDNLDNYSSNNSIITSSLKVGESVSYTLRLWVDYNTGNDAQNKYFATQIRIVGTQVNAE